MSFWTNQLHNMTSLKGMLQSVCVCLYTYEWSTWNLNDLHSVQQSWWDGGSSVGSSYEKNLGKVKGHI